MGQETEERFGIRKSNFRFRGSGCIGWGSVVLLDIFFIQNAWASIYENELRAAVIYLGIAILILLGAAITYFSRHIETQ